jgi:hypothetical protein
LAFPKSLRRFAIVIGVIQTSFALIGCDPPTLNNPSQRESNKSSTPETIAPALTQLEMQALANTSVSAESPMLEQAAQVVSLGARSLSYACAYDTQNDGVVAPAAMPCSLLGDLNGLASFDATLGRLNWTPPLATAGSTYEFKITVTDGMLSASRVFSVQVLSPRPSLSQSTLTISAGTVVSGSTRTLTFQGKSSAGVNLTYGGAVVTFSTVGGTSTGTFSPTIDNGDGTYSATFTGLQAGNATTIYAAVSGFNITTTAPTVTVTPGAVSLAASGLSVSSSSILAGATSTVTLTARDANGNQLAAGGLTVVFAKSGGTSNGTFAATVDHADGTYTSVFTGTVAGNPTAISATIGGSSVTSLSPTIAVNPGTPIALAFTTQPSASTSPMNPFPVQPVVSVIDSQGNPVTTGAAATASIALTLTPVTGSGTLGGTATMNAVAGVASFVGKNLLITDNGSYRLTATASALALTQNSNLIAITTTAPTLTVSRPISIAYRTSATGAAAVTTGMVSATTGSGSAANTASIGTATTTMLTMTGSAFSATNTPPAYENWTDQSTPTFTVTVANANSPACTVLGAFSSVACGLPSFPLSFLDVKNAATSVAGGTNVLKVNDGFIDSSTSLPVTKYLVDLVTRNNPTSNDVVMDHSGIMYNGDYYFVGYNTFGRTKIFKITSSGVYSQVTNFLGNGATDISFTAMAAANNSLYFVASDSMLYRYDGSNITRITQASTLGLVSGNYSGYWLTPSSDGTRMYFMMRDAGNHYKLHYADNSNNVVQATDLNSGGDDLPDSNGDSDLMAFNNAIYFRSPCTSAGCTGFASSLKRVAANNTVTNLVGLNVSTRVTYNNVLYPGSWSGYPGSLQPLQALSTADALTRASNAFMPFTTGNGTPMVFQGQLMGTCHNSYNRMKLCKLNPTTLAVSQVTDTASYPNAEDWPLGLGTLQQGATDQAFFFSALAGGLIRKVFMMDTAGKVSQVTNLVTDGDDINAPAGTYPGFIQIGFQLPTGPSGANEFYFSAREGTAAVNYTRIFKVYPSP